MFFALCHSLLFFFCLALRWSRARNAGADFEVAQAFHLPPRAPRLPPTSAAITITSSGSFSAMRKTFYAPNVASINNAVLTEGPVFYSSLLPPLLLCFADGVQYVTRRIMNTDVHKHIYKPTATDK